MSTPERRIRSGPGEFTVVAVLWGVFGLYSLAHGFVDDRAPLVVVGAAAFAVMLVGLLGPIVSLWRVSVKARTAADATAGAEVDVVVTVHGRARGVQVRLVEPAGETRWADLPSSGVLRCGPLVRGVHRRVVVEVRTSGPLAVFMRRRLFAVPLEVPLYVAPRPVAVAWTPQHAAGDDGAADDAALQPGVTESVRGVRPYVSGDPARSVHWPSSARTGSLVVRDFEPPTRVVLAIVLDLRGGDAEAVEAAVARAAGLGRVVLAAQGELLLATHERAPVVAAVPTVRALDRRLAAARRGDPGPSPDSVPVERITS